MVRAGAGNDGEGVGRGGHGGGSVRLEVKTRGNPGDYSP